MSENKESRSRACKLLLHRCLSCDKRFQTKEELKEHIKWHQALKCSTCGKFFTKKSRFEKHLKLHSINSRANALGTGVKTLDKIKSIFSDEENVERSVSIENTIVKEDPLTEDRKQTTDKDKDYTDNDKDKDYTPDDDEDDDDDDDDTPTSSMYCEDYSHGLKTYRCRRCPKKFHHHHSLVEHMRVHTGEKPYECSKCNLAFTTSGNLIRHERTHLNLKLYQCKICDLRFTQSTSLVLHMSRAKCFKDLNCPVCKKRFSTTEELRAHIRAHKDGPFKCSKCDRGFQTVAIMLKHRSFCFKIIYKNGEHKIVRNGDENHENSSEEKEEDLDYDIIDLLLCSLITNKKVHPTVCSRCKNAFLDMNAFEAHKKYCTRKLISAADVDHNLARKNQNKFKKEPLIKAEKRWNFKQKRRSTRVIPKRELVTPKEESSLKRGSKRIRRKPVVTNGVESLNDGINVDMCDFGIVTSIKLIGQEEDVSMVLLPDYNTPYYDPEGDFTQKWKIVQSSGNYL